MSMTKEENDRRLALTNRDIRAAIDRNLSPREQDAVAAALAPLLTNPVERRAQLARGVFHKKVDATLAELRQPDAAVKAAKPCHAFQHHCLEGQPPVDGRVILTQVAKGGNVDRGKKFGKTITKLTVASVDYEKPVRLHAVVAREAEHLSLCCRVIGLDLQTQKVQDPDDLETGSSSAFETRVQLEGAAAWFTNVLHHHIAWGHARKSRVYARKSGEVKVVFNGSLGGYRITAPIAVVSAAMPLVCFSYEGAYGPDDTMNLAAALMHAMGKRQLSAVAWLNLLKAFLNVVTIPRACEGGSLTAIFLPNAAAAAVPGSPEWVVFSIYPIPAKVAHGKKKGAGKE